MFSQTRFFATCARGIEPVTARELELLGASGVKPGYGGAFFEGDRELLYRANLELRTATRVLVPLREFAAKTPAMLYDQVRRMKWDRLLTPETTFAVDCTMAGQGKQALSNLRERPAGRVPFRRLKREVRRGDEMASGRLGSRAEGGLRHSGFVALKIKDAIVDQLRDKYGARPDIDTENPSVKISAYLHEGRCQLSLDSSGTSLHERGYRLGGAAAPLKETLAAALLDLSGWDPATPFLDPMCGSGTLPLEAALKSMRIAPGLFRERFGFFGWRDFDEPLWSRLIDQARQRVAKQPLAPIVGFDTSRDAIATALKNSTRAGLTRAVHLERRELARLEPVGEAPGTAIVNPPYGERLGEIEELRSLYRQLGDFFKQRLTGWTAFVFTGSPELAKCVGLHPSRRIPLFNGPIECRLLKYELY